MNETFKTKLKAMKSCDGFHLRKINNDNYVLNVGYLRGALTALKLKENDIIEVTLKKVKK